MFTLLHRLGRRVKRSLRPRPGVIPADAIDDVPWDHPYLTRENLQRFRDYCGQAWEFARAHHLRRAEPLDVAFCVNIAQTAYKWATLAQAHGANATLYPHPLDHNALSQPEWEDFDGEFPDVHDGPTFLGQIPASQKLRANCVRVPLGGDDLFEAIDQFAAGDRRPLFKVLGAGPRDLRLEPFLVHDGTYPLFPLAQALARHEAVLVPGSPVTAYLSGRPYLAQSIGGDLQFEAGKADEYGQLVGLAFSGARFITFTNPHIIGFCRRFGYTNGLYMPYTMDDDRYCPGVGRARAEWVAEHGEGVYVLSSARIDNAVKGNGDDLLEALVQAARACPTLRYVFLQWGHSAQAFMDKVRATGVGNQFVFRKPVGKERLIDYLRSCDAVLDQFVYGYYGATGLEAAAVGKPILMRIREDHYGPLYLGDIAPVINLPNATALTGALVRLVAEPDWHRRRGEELRAWLVRNHGAQRMMPILLGVLRLAADRIPLPPDIEALNPLTDPESAVERKYRLNCLRPRPDLVVKAAELPAAGRDNR
jgi:glycosyltransferase involved in cell wall biosynthesis